MESLQSLVILLILCGAFVVVRICVFCGISEEFVPLIAIAYAIIIVKILEKL